MKSKFTLICLFLAIISSYRAEAQTTVQMGTGTLSPTNTLYSPVYRFSATSTTSAVRSDIMFTAAEMAAAGIPVGATITKVEFNKTNANNFVTPANFKMYMGNTSSTALATTLTWASILTTHSLVFTNTALNLPATTGWVSWNLNSPFTYTGGTFELATEMTMVGNGGATGNILWEYTSTVPTTYIVGAFGTALPATLNGAVADYKRRPNIRITYINARTPNNAGIEKLIEPINFCGGNQDIKVKLKNFGSNQISFVNINWELDGIPMPIIYWSSLLDTTGGFGVSDTVITLDTAVSFASGLAKSLKVWTSLPNGLVDSTTSDDTLYAMLKPSLAAGVYTVGPSGNFASLTEVSNELKFGVCGSVIFEIQSSYNSSVETLPITFKEISGANSTTGVIIRPESIASSINISGSHANTIIDLDRTKFLTIDGRAGGNGASVLTIENTSTSGAAIRFINSAQFDTLQYVTFKASNTLASSGVVFFSNTTDTSIAGGNSFNTIRNCKINGNSSSLNCLFSSGNSNAASNKFNKIFTSDFFDFFSNVSASLPSGIHLSTGSSDWIIGGIGLGNNFYQTAARHPSSTPALTTAVNFKAIYINDLNGKGFYIIENNIGGNITGITGSIFELGNTSTNVGITCRGIEVNAVSNSTLSYIQGNIIKNMVVFSTVTNFYAGIFTTNGHIDISHNIIGSDIGNHSLTMTHLGTTALANVYGIRISGTTGFIKNNVIGSFSGQQLNASGNMQILSIYLTGTFTDPFYVENNFIGSNTTANSIQSMFSSIGGINVMGIVASGATGNQLHFTKNWIRNLSVLSTFNGANNGVKGIYVTGVSTARTHITQNIISDLYSESRNPNVNQSASINGITTVTSSSGSQFIANNTIYNLILTPTLSVASAAIGIYYGSTNTASNNSIENNHIFGLGSNQNNDNAILTGISAGAGSTTFPLKLVNNMISIGSDSTGASYIGSAQINGVLKTVGMIALYHNTINIHGAGVLNNAVNTFAFRRTNTAIDTLLNNIFVNKRINATSGGGHFTLGVDTSLTLTSDYNALFSNSAIALSNASSLLNLSDWTLAYNIDLNSVSTTLVFQNDSNLHLSGSSLGNVILGCNPLSFVLLDFDGQIRNNVKTYMGADEAISHLLPIELAWFNATRDGEDVRLNWASVSEINSDYFEVQASIDGNSFEPITQINAAGNSTKMIRYSAFHNQALQFAASQSAIFYRLKLVDIDGSFEYSAIRKVDVKGDQPSFGMAYPNPFVNEINVDFVNENADQVIFNLYDQNGMKILSTSGVALNTTFTINDLGYLKAGFYLLRIYTNTHTHTYKVWKKE